MQNGGKNVRPPVWEVHFSNDVDDFPKSRSEMFITPLLRKDLEYEVLHELIVSRVDAIAMLTLVVHHILQYNKCRLPNIHVVVITVCNIQKISAETLTPSRSLDFALARFQHGWV